MRKTATLIACMAAIALPAGSAFSDRMMKSEKVKKVPATSQNSSALPAARGGSR